MTIEGQLIKLSLGNEELKEVLINAILPSIFHERFKSHGNVHLMVTWFLIHITLITTSPHCITNHLEAPHVVVSKSWAKICCKS
jgi:hypothetical protein